MLDLDARIERSWMLIDQLFPLTVLLAAWRVGPWALLPLVSVPIFMGMSKVLPRMRRPELLMMTALVTFSGTVAIAAGLTGGVHSPLIYWELFYMVGCASRFGGRGLLFATAFGTSATLLAALVPDPGRAWRDLPTLVTLLSVGLVAGRYTRILTTAEFDHRKAALVDNLTGLLNRTALESRFEAERQQAIHAGTPLTAILCDLDHFKLVNDHHGHDRGDAVLRDTATALRRALRSDELVFRIGGEEFLCLLPRAELADGMAVGERLRSVVAAAWPSGLEVTASFGVASARAAEIDYDDLFRRVDAALYAAKAAGRNRVAGDVQAEPQLLAA